MPYIPREHRRAIDNGIPPDNAGELNYKICTVLIDYILEKGMSYQVLNEVIGVLECIKQEVYRKIAGPYEDEKEGLNGTIWPDFGKASK